MLPKNGKSDLTSADLWFIFTDEQISQNARGSQVMVLILTEVGRIDGGQRLDERLDSSLVSPGVEVGAGQPGSSFQRLE